ncbi:MAG: bifunctional [glutamine synthetase] adenylyltransferase/[glutamine synthetase]-adenylyl-L-tyrosine phosphorylase, partial [Streptosporangiaceae bacterium]
MTGRLARLGFADPGGAERLLARSGLAPSAEESTVLDALAAVPDPDLALAGLARVAEAAPDRDVFIDALRAEPELRTRLLAVLGCSRALGEHLARHPERWRLTGDEPSSDVRADLLGSVGADVRDAEPRACQAGRPALDALRAAYRDQLLRVAASDLTGRLTVDQVGELLAELAAATLDAALAVARAEIPPSAAPCRLAVIGMGKCGGRELNYASDVDVVFVAEPAQGSDEHEAQREAQQDAQQDALHTGERLAAGLIRTCSEAAGERPLWPVDAALRPEGRAGPLVRTLASHVAYYERWAKTWEFQALLKARPVAGDSALGEAYVAALRPMVWRAADRDGFVEDVQAMRRRVEAHVPQAEADRQLKLGPGGLRDVEFAVQLLQLVHGRSDPALRSSTTLAALEALSRGGYVGRADAAGLANAYRFLRTLEHRIQLHRLRRTHAVPTGEQELRRLGRAMGLYTDPVATLTTRWRTYTREVRRLHEKLFYRPLLLAVARLPGEEARLTPEAARQRLEALGYADPAGALRHIEALTAGVSRRAAIQRTLLPVMLGWFADAPDPDAGLLGFRKVSDALGATHWYLRLLRDERGAAERLATLLASSRYVTDLLLRAPEAVTMLGDDAELMPRARAGLEAEMLASVRRHDDPETGIAAVRALRRRELFRVATADLLGMLDVAAVGEALTAITAATVAAGLEAAAAAVAAEREQPLPRLTVVAMGRFGGRELGYASDADVLFVFEPPTGGGGDDGAPAAHAVTETLRSLLARPSPDPPLSLDADLRPEGRRGPLVRSLAAYEAYYARWSSPWERQALLRAEPIAGDPEVAKRFLAVIDPIRWPREGIDRAEVREIRRLKARMEAERLPRGTDPTIHTKLGRGGLSDVEWVAQLLQLRHACAVPVFINNSSLES